MERLYNISRNCTSSMQPNMETKILTLAANVLLLFVIHQSTHFFFVDRVTTPRQGI
jgi:hypothetical protein